jgi:hypothetical protein
MQVYAPTGFIRNFHDRLNDRGRVLSVAVVLIGLMVALVAAVSHPRDMINNSASMLLVLAWFLLILIPLDMPRLILNLAQAFQGVPALRISEKGIWSRRWSQFGWISWSDIAAVEIVHQRVRNATFHHLRIELRNKLYGQLPWNDKLAQLILRPLRLLTGARAGGQTFDLVSTTSLKQSWDDVLSALEPMLVVNGICRREVDSRFRAWGWP